MISVTTKIDRRHSWKPTEVYYKAMVSPEVRERHRKGLSMAISKWWKLPDVQDKLTKNREFRKLVEFLASQLRKACVNHPDRQKWQAERRSFDRLMSCFASQLQKSCLGHPDRKKWMMERRENSVRLYKERWKTDPEFRAKIFEGLKRGHLRGRLGTWEKVDKVKFAETMRVALKRNISRPEKFIEACFKASGHSFTAQAQLPGLLEIFGKTCIWDFIVPNKKLAVEVDGERWHNREKDAARDQMAAQLGWRVVRIPVKKVLVKSPAYKRWLKTYRWPTEVAA